MEFCTEGVTPRAQLFAFFSFARVVREGGEDVCEILCNGVTGGRNSVTWRNVTGGEILFCPRSVYAKQALENVTELCFSRFYVADRNSAQHAGRTKPIRLFSGHTSNLNDMVTGEDLNLSLCFLPIMY